MRPLRRPQTQHHNHRKQQERNAIPKHRARLRTMPRLWWLRQFLCKEHSRRSKHRSSTEQKSGTLHSQQDTRRRRCCVGASTMRKSFPKSVRVRQGRASSQRVRGRGGFVFFGLANNAAANGLSSLHDTLSPSIPALGLRVTVDNRLLVLWFGSAPEQTTLCTCTDFGSAAAKRFTPRNHSS